MDMKNLKLVLARLIILALTRNSLAPPRRQLMNFNQIFRSIFIREVKRVSKTIV